jgi:excisionase family DNA binding protein
MATIVVPDGMTAERALAAVRATAAEPLLTPGEVSTLFRCDVKTVTRWAVAGKLHSIRTPGGHRRFFENEVKALMRGGEWELPPEYANVA